uniref:Uncharacterized protein n=1 Tax=Siphoviridae sp. ctOb14 TaxID=2827862 RepID=A0A8S5SLP5_9CAUD|nr:MAG TPA: hypothetical protein [Siphoviridae sp. ctOb14]
MAITAKKVSAGDEIKAEDHNTLVDDVIALDEKPSKGEKGDTGAAGKDGAAGAKGEKGDTGAKGATGAAGKDGFGTEAQYNDIITRLDALEAAGE